MHHTFFVAMEKATANVMTYLDPVTPGYIVVTEIAGKVSLASVLKYKRE
jgi:hypothetical protein